MHGIFICWLQQWIETYSNRTLSPKTVHTKHPKYILQYSRTVQESNGMITIMILMYWPFKNLMYNIIQITTWQMDTQLQASALASYKVQVGSSSPSALTILNFVIFTSPNKKLCIIITTMGKFVHIECGCSHKLAMELLQSNMLSQGNQQECSRLSKWFSLRCFGSG